MSVDRPEQYPEVGSEELGIVPPQDGPPVEWPKKIRMLSASELDRLTIDGAGRFYWDGRLVNYPAMQQQRAEPVKVDPLDRNAFDLLDRAALELSDHSDTPHQVTPAAPPVSIEKTRPAGEVRPVDLDSHLVPPVAPSPVASPQVAPVTQVEPAEHPTLVPPTVRAPSERFSVRLSAWQSIGLILVILGFLAGTFGLAAHGWVAAHAWGCRVGLVTQYCPPPLPAPAAPSRPDIPA